MSKRNLETELDLLQTFGIDGELEKELSRYATDTEQDVILLSFEHIKRLARKKKDFKTSVQCTIEQAKILGFYGKKETVPPISEPINSDLIKQINDTIQRHGK